MFKIKGELIIKKLQLAIDLFDLKSSLKLLKKVADYFEIIELGTPLIISEGLSIIPVIKELYPEKIVFADLKVMDGGGIIPDLAFQKGADMVSVLAAANNSTIKASIKSAAEFKKEILIDMCSVSKIKKRAEEIDRFSPAYISVHRAADMKMEEIDPLKNIKFLKNIKAKKAVAGGINLNNFEKACKSSADIIIVGGAVYKNEKPEYVAEKMRKIIDNY
ncbi:3-hexulose-6-phosphate synthase [Halanaerobium saccharolyticum]